MADTVARLEPFLLMARSAKGAAAAKIIVDATSAPSVFGFGELLDMPNIQALETHEQHSTAYNLLLLFAYGTYTEYQANTSLFLTLSPTQVNKLKQLTLVSLAHESRFLPYDHLLEVLSIPSVRDLEDLIIDCMYSQVLGGRLDQKLSALHIDWVIGRDVQTSSKASAFTATSAQGASRSGTIQDLGQRLSAWCTLTDNLLSSIDEKVLSAKQAAQYDKDELEAYNISRDALCENLMNEGRNKGGDGGSGFGGGKGKGKRAAGPGGGFDDVGNEGKRVEHDGGGSKKTGGGGGRFEVEEGASSKKGQGRTRNAADRQLRGGGDLLDLEGISQENRRGSRRAPQDQNAIKRTRHD